MRLGLTAALLLSTSPALAQDTLATVARAMYGDMAVIVQTRANQVRLAIDDGTQNLYLSFVGTDVRRWSDSTQRYFTRRRRKSDQTVWSSALHEPGMRAGTASLTIRTVEAGKGQVYTLFFADDSLITVRGEVDREDAQAFARHLRQAAQMALGSSKLSRPAAAKPKPKRVAPPPPPKSGSASALPLVTIAATWHVVADRADSWHRYSDDRTPGRAQPHQAPRATHHAEPGCARP